MGGGGLQQTHRRPRRDLRHRLGGEPRELLPAAAAPRAPARPAARTIRRVQRSAIVSREAFTQRLADEVMHEHVLLLVTAHEPGVLDRLQRTRGGVCIADDGGDERRPAPRGR